MKKEVKIPLMKTIRETAELLGLPEHFVRSKVNNGEVVSVNAGKKKLVNVDKFIEHLNTGTITPLTEDEAGNATVQKIPRR